jgi:branched-chain amino acid transport system permease protein
MLQYIIAGLVIGCIYAIASTGLAVTYQSSGILNFGFGGIAFAVARLYYFLNSEHGWPIWSAGIFSILIAAPALGAFLYFALFRYLSRGSSLVKIIATIGLGVALPPIALLAFGNPPIVAAPGLAPEPVASYMVFGTAVTMDQIIVVLSLLVILAAGFVILRFTEAGLLVRAMVDSPALSSLAGSNPERSSLAVWVVTTTMAGLAGVLLAPIVGLSSGQYNLLIAAAFAAVLLAKLTRVGRVIIISLVLGIVSSVAEYLMPPTSPITSGVIAGMPFAFILVFLLWEARKGEVAEGMVLTGHLDRAIAQPTGTRRGEIGSNLTLRLHYPMGTRTLANRRVIGSVVTMAIIALIPFGLSSFWTSQLTAGVCFGVIFLAFTLVIGEGGMIWLCQAGFAGIGAVFTAHLATADHVPVLLAVILSAIVVGPMGVVVGVLTTRLGDLYVALATLALGLLIDNVVLSLPVFTGPTDVGLSVSHPSFASGTRAYFYLVLVAFAIAALLVEHFRRSTAGLAMSAVRWSERGARSTGIRVAYSKAGISGAAAFIAAVGGGLLVVYYGQATPSSFSTTTGLMWLAVLVTVGIQSNVAAIVAGLTYAIFPALFQSYLPLSWAQVPPALFGLGAVLVARNPSGVVATNIRQADSALDRIRGKGRRSGPDAVDPGHTEVGEMPTGLHGEPVRHSS